MTYLLPGFSAEMPEKKDLLVLTADKDANLGIGALLNRQVDLGIRSITFECRSHPKHDSGVLIGAHDFLRPFLRYFEYALVVFDLEGCGREGLGRAGVERKIHENLTANGWQGRCEVVAINPELESWVWDETLRVAPAVGQTTPGGLAPPRRVSCRDHGSNPCGQRRHFGKPCVPPSGRCRRLCFRISPNPRMLRVAPTRLSGNSC